MNRLAQDFKPPSEMPRRTMPLLLSDAGMGPLVAFFACRGMNLYAHTLGRVSKCGALGQRWCFYMRFADRTLRRTLRRFFHL